MWKNLKIWTKLVIMSGIFIFGIGTVYMMSDKIINDLTNKSLDNLEASIRSEFDDYSKSQVVNVCSMLQILNDKCEAGEYTLEEAKLLGSQLLRDMRYKDGGYFWADTLDGTNVVLLGNETEGTNRYNSEDAYGNKYIQDMIKVSQQADGGYSDYYFPKEGETEASPKRAYTKYFEPFGWIIGTGNYVDDIDKTVALERESLEQEKEAQTRIVALIVFIVFLFSILVMVITIVGIANGFKNICNVLKSMSDGDFTFEIPNKYKNRKDEFGVVTDAVENVVTSVGGLIYKVKEESKNIYDNMIKVSGSVGELNEEVEGISATVEELAAGMEETSASSEEMAASSQNAEEASTVLADRANDGASEVIKISERATKTKQSVMLSQKKAESLIGDISGKLQAALEEATVIREIEALAEAIMSITSQTNLLALNASIEAARAGEAGRGFAVVANEIGALANQSRETVGKIKDITGNVTTAVQNLSDNAQGLLSFVSSDVTRDYNDFLEISEYYNGDAEFVANLVSEFDGQSQSLQSLMENIGMAVKHVAQAASEGAEGTSEIAARTSGVKTRTESIYNMVTEVDKSVQKLEDNVKKFTL